MTTESSLADTDLCVMCGMCTPLCPTYHIYKTEMESPRGRIALMQALDKNIIKPTSSVMTHLNHCLGCMACERICPSDVPFGRLMDTVKQAFPSTNHSLSHKLLLKLSTQKQGMDFYQRPVQLIKQSGLLKFLPRSSKARSILEQAQSVRFDDFYPAHGTRRGAVGLFKGCLGKMLDAHTLLDAIQLLTYLGFDVQMPENQYCCGALHQHNGDMPEAQKLAEQNRQQFQPYKLDYILYTASGCGSQINHSELPAPTMDLVSFLLEQLMLQPYAIKPSNKHVIVHQACRGKNELGLTQANRDLLQHIPGISIHHFQQKDFCCGAGGSNQLDYPELSNALLSIKLDEIKTISADYLVSDNLGCLLHFKAGLKRNKLNIEAIHPVTLLARQMI